MKILLSFISLSCFLSGSVYAGVSEMELAKLLVKLELQTRAVIASKFSKSKGDSKEFMIEHKILPAAYYYAEPIVVTKACLECHGNPKEAPDPHFPEYWMEGWKVDQVIGGVVAKVTKE